MTEHQDTKMISEDFPSFHSLFLRAPYEVFDVLARVEQNIGLASHISAHDGYTLVQIWSLVHEFECEFCVWSTPPQTEDELRFYAEKHRSEMVQFQAFEQKLKDKAEREARRRELLARLTSEERELLGV